MRTLVMVVVLLVAVLGQGCRKRIPVANTAEGNKCRRECMLVYQACMGARGGGKHVCRNQEDDCLHTCPTAAEAAALASGETPPPPPAAPLPVPAGQSCVASQLPEWQTASAAEKKALLERCRAPAPAPAAAP